VLHSRLVRYIDAVAREGSFHRASETLNVATSAISRQITAYEQDLGLPLFERRARGLRLTSAGETVLTHVRATLTAHRQMMLQIDSMKGLKAGTVRVATAAGLAAALLPNLAARFCRDHPRVEIDVRVMPIDDILGAVASGAADLGLAFDAPPDPRVNGLASVNLVLGLVVAPDHPLAGRATVRLSDCAGLDLLLPDESLTLRRQIDFAFAEAQIVPALRAVSDSIDFLKRMVIEGAGATILSVTDVLNEVSGGQVAYVPFVGRLPAGQTLKLLSARQGSLEPMPALFAEIVKEALAGGFDEIGLREGPAPGRR